MAVNAIDAIGAAFSKTFRGSRLWIVLGVASFIIFATYFGFLVAGMIAVANDPESAATTSAMPTATVIVDLLIVFAAILFGPFLYRLALREFTGPTREDATDKVPVFGPKYFTIVGLSILLPLLAFAPAWLVVALLATFDASGIALLIMLPALMLLSILIAPLYQLSLFFAADKQQGFIDSAKSGFELGKKHYGQLLLLNVLIGLISFAGMLFFGLGLLVIVPVQYISLAYMYYMATRNNDEHTQVVTTVPAV